MRERRLSKAQQESNRVEAVYFISSSGIINYHYYTQVVLDSPFLYSVWSTTNNLPLLVGLLNDPSQAV